MRNYIDIGKMTFLILKCGHFRSMLECSDNLQIVFKCKEISMKYIVANEGKYLPSQA